MNRPKVQKYNSPKHIDDYPVGPSFDAGYLTSINAGWRMERPVLDVDRCITCYQCYMCCPDGVIFKKDKVVDFDFDYCKGCGICAQVCPKNALSMVLENK